MDINSILPKLESRKDIDVRLYFTRKKNNNTYISYSPSISPDLQSDLLGIVKTALHDVKDKEQRTFNPIGSLDDCIENCKVSDVANIEEILFSTSEDFVVRKPLTVNEISKLSFYCLKITITYENDVDNPEELVVFRRVKKFNRLKKGIIGQFIEGDFEKLQSDLLGIDSDIDVVIFNDDVLVINHISLERIFSLRDQYIDKATHTLDIVKGANKISNFEQFREDCLNDGRVIRALTKILDDEARIQQCFENFDNVIEVVNIFELDIRFEVDNNALIYEDKSQLLDITRLIRDSFYRTLINKREGIDEGV